MRWGEIWHPKHKMYVPSGATNQPVISCSDSFNWLVIEGGLISYIIWNMIWRNAPLLCCMPLWNSNLTTPYSGSKPKTCPTTSSSNTFLGMHIVHISHSIKIKTHITLVPSLTLKMICQPNMTLQLKRKYICLIEIFAMGNHHFEHIYPILFKYFSILLTMQPTTRNNEMLIDFSKNCGWLKCRWTLEEPSGLSKLGFNDVTCVKINPSQCKSCCWYTLLASWYYNRFSCLPHNRWQADHHSHFKAPDINHPCV